MAIALEQFVRQLEESGILAGDTLKDYVPPNGSPKDAEELARELVRKKKLTKFQAEELYRGKGKSLVLGNYILMEKIGAGGMGQVFKARHRRMDRLVAVKLLPSTMTKDKAAIARFEREVKAAAKLRHPNIVAADDADCANGFHFLVMELVDGQDLSVLVKKNGPLSVEKALNYVLQVARGLEFAHKKGVVHRDIKPANLLLDKEGTVKILDMGLARLGGVGEDSEHADLTSTGTIMGTVDYMAPEQALDTKTADARADIYALGCSLHYLLTGKATYDGDTIMKKLLAHRDQPIPSLRADRHDVPLELDTVFRRMLAKRVEDRFQTMSELIAELELLEVRKESHEATLIIQQTVSVPPSSNTSGDNSTFHFLQDRAVTPTIHKAKAKPRTAPASQGTAGRPPWKNIKVLIGAGLLGVLLLASIIVSLDTRDGKLIVEVNQQDVIVQVLDSEGKVEISQKGVVGKVTISVDPGKHRLKVVKDGFTTYGQEFEMEKGGHTEITARLEPLEAKPAPAARGTMPMPGFDEWVTQVQAMPAEQQVQAVSDKLIELNPGFDGKVNPTIEHRVVWQLEFWTDNVTDISPVRAMAQLESLKCEARDKSLLSDLSPLKGTKITAISCSNTSVSDLSPLREMKLKHFDCSGTNVIDLSPLKDMKLINLLCGYTPVSDLSSLQGMPLELFVCGNTKVGDLTTLKDMPLKLLWCGSTQVTDLKPLEGLMLTELRIDHTQVSDLSPLRGMPLTLLRCDATSVMDFSPLESMVLKELSLDFNTERDSDLLRSIKTLETINEKPVAEFWKELGEQQEGKKLGFQMPGFDQWVKEVQSMPAEQQVEAVSKKLVELNPGFDGKVTQQISEGVVLELAFSTDHVTDISPVRALLGLKNLNCSGTLAANSGVLNDLSPLSGMKLRVLGIQATQVTDLSPLRDMTLTHLRCTYAKISDLSPLKGQSLTDLQVENTSVRDLSPLEGMPLKSLQLDGTHVSNLSPLRKMTFDVLGFHRTLVTDLSPLKEISVQHLHLEFAADWDAAILRSIRTLETINEKPATEFFVKLDTYKAEAEQPLAIDNPDFALWIEETSGRPAEEQLKAVIEKLQQLNPGFDGTVMPTVDSGIVTGLQFSADHVSDISPVRALEGLSQLSIHGSADGTGKVISLKPLTGLQLRSLQIYSTKVHDLSPLREMKLTSLHCSGTFVSDCSPLKGMPLEFLDVSKTRVHDLSPLTGAPLNELWIFDSLVSDLTPLKGMSLRILSAASHQLSDFSVIKDMPLRYLGLVFNPQRHTDLLRSIKTLDTVNDKPIAEFWKEVEATKP